MASPVGTANFTSPSQSHTHFGCYRPCMDLSLALGIAGSVLIHFTRGHPLAVLRVLAAPRLVCGPSGLFLGFPTECLEPLHTLLLSSTPYCLGDCMLEDCDGCHSLASELPDHCLGSSNLVYHQLQRGSASRGRPRRFSSWASLAALQFLTHLLHTHSHSKLLSHMFPAFGPPPFMNVKPPGTH